MILNRQRRVGIRPAVLNEFLARIRGAVGVSSESVSICLVSDAAMAQMNRRYRGKRGATDVLSFPANGTQRKERRERSERKERRQRIQKGPRQSRASSSLSFISSLSSPSSDSSSSFLGDIAISPETARRNARRFRRTLDDELRILILHGVLHLLGYDHEADHGEMQRLETRLRRELLGAGA
jgi:probable rRNA maturation factor